MKNTKAQAKSKLSEAAAEKARLIASQAPQLTQKQKDTIRLCLNAGR